jgi:2-dehydropantoate 2-reductase
MKIMVLGAGVQGTLYGVRLAREGHDVTLVAHAARAAELRQRGAIIEDALSGRTETACLAIEERLVPSAEAAVCLVAVRREQIQEVLSDLAAATAISRIVFMVNHANGSESIFNALRRSRVVLAFPGAAGSIDNGVGRYVEIKQQPTVVESSAPDVVSLFRNAGFRVTRVSDMDAWLRRHAVFVTAVAGALYEKGGDAERLAASPEGVSTFIQAVREGWTALDRQHIQAAPVALRTILCWVPLPFAISYGAAFSVPSAGICISPNTHDTPRWKWRPWPLTCESCWGMSPPQVSTGSTLLLIVRRSIRQGSRQIFHRVSLCRYRLGISLVQPALLS